MGAGLEGSDSWAGHMWYTIVRNIPVFPFLGVYEIARRMCYEVPDIDHALNEKEKMTVMAAALLHD